MPSQSNTTGVPGPTEWEHYFERICDGSQHYPNNFGRSKQGVKARQAVADTWNREASRIFGTKAGNSPLKIFQTCTCTTQCNCRLICGDTKTQDDLSGYLQPTKKAPQLTYISIQSPSSKSRLRCPVLMFKHICTYQQIPPSFLTCLYSFRISHSPYEWCHLPLFNDDNTLLSRKQDVLPLERQGRSGREIRYSFVLRSVESSNSITIPNSSPWAIRQLAVYHSFDVVSGQALWLTCKGNSANEELFREAMTENDSLKPNALRSVPEAFSASLEMLTMILDWCEDDWRFYINEIVDEVSKKAAKSRTANIEDQPDVGRIRRLVTGLADPPTEKLPRTTTLESGRLRSFTRSFSMNLKNQAEDNTNHPEDDFGKLEALKIFSFHELQVLQAALEKVQEALLTLKLNAQVIKQIREHYQSLMNQYHIPEMKEIQKNCKDSVLQLCRRSRNIEANIEARQAQLDTLLFLVKESKDMYNGILQYKSFQINKIYAESAQNIANKTKQETTSMHIITFVTLIFLPGTFIASFFQSGILEWPELNPKEAWKLNKQIFGLFFGISATITVVIILVWMAILFMLRRQVKMG